MMNEVGIIYILTNESMPGLIKIGSTKDIKKRLKDLDKTGIPTPFKLYYAIEIENYVQKEHQIHQGYAKDRVRPNREFFRVEPENATAMLKALGGKDISLEYIDISIDENGREVSTDVYGSRLPFTPNTTFEMLKIEVGSKLTFTRNSRLTCEVYDNRKVKFGDNIYSLSILTSQILKKQYGWKSNNVNGFQFWKYEEEILTDRRNRLESEQIEEINI